MLFGQHATTAQLIDKISQHIINFKPIHERMFELVVNPKDNTPAISLAAQRINPISRKVQQLSKRLEDQIKKSADSDQPALENVISLQYAWEAMISDMSAYLLFRTDSDRSQLVKSKKVVSDALNTLKQQSESISDKPRKTLSGVLKFSGKALTSLDKVIEIHSSDDWRIDASIIRDELGPELSAVSESLAELIAFQKEQIQNTSNSLLSELAQAGQALIVLLSIGLICGIAIALIVGNKVLFLINNLRTAFDELASGDLTHRLSTTGGSETKLIAESFNQFGDQIQALVYDLSQITESLLNSSTQSSTLSLQSIEGIRVQKKNSEEIEQASNDISSSITNVIDQSSIAATQASLAFNEANKGKNVVLEAKDSIQALAQMIDTGADTLSQLKEQSERIGTVLSTIRGIADQTNLLALNAAIEAARAGEQGRGFAVVADEVRLLATRTQESTTEIQETITTLQNGTEGAVSMMLESRDQAHSSVKLALEAGDTLIAITQAVSDINDVNAQIVDATTEQGNMGDKITETAQRMQGRVENSTERANNVSKVSDELSSIAANLDSKINKFNI